MSVRVFLLGGTGAIGVHALPALVAAGHEVSALVRTPEKAAVVAAQGAEPVVVSMFDRAALSERSRGHDAVVNLATSMPSMATFVFRRAWRPTERVRIEGSAVVVDAALAAGLPRLVQESVSMVYPDRGDELIDEDVEPDPYPNARGNLGAEASARRFSEGGGSGIVLRLACSTGPVRATASSSSPWLAITSCLSSDIPSPTSRRSTWSTEEPPSPQLSTFLPVRTTLWITSRSPSVNTRRRWPSQPTSVLWCVAQAGLPSCSATGWRR